MWLSLKSKNKLGFIDGTAKPAIHDPNYATWDRCNTYVLAWINQVLDPEVVENVQWMSTAAEVWSDLKKRFCHGDVFRVAEIHEEVYSLKQGDMSIIAFFTKLKSLWQELESFTPIPNCTC